MCLSLCKLFGRTFCAIKRISCSALFLLQSHRDAERDESDNNGANKVLLLFRRDDMRLLGVHVIGEHATELLNWCISVCLPCLWKEGAKCLPVLVLTFQLSAIFIESRLARLWRLGSRPGERNLPTNPARKLGIPVDEAGRRWSAEVPEKVSVCAHRHPSGARSALKPTIWLGSRSFAKV